SAEPPPTLWPECARSDTAATPLPSRAALGPAEYDRSWRGRLSTAPLTSRYPDRTGPRLRRCAAPCNPAVRSEWKKSRLATGEHGLGQRQRPLKYRPLPQSKCAP